MSYPRPLLNPEPRNRRDGWWWFWALVLTAATVGCAVLLILPDGTA